MVEPEVVRIPPNNDELVVGVEDIAADSLSRRRGRREAVGGAGGGTGGGTGG